MLWETIRLALLSVRRNVLRSFLTLLGIVIGVAAVIAMITIGCGTTEKVQHRHLQARQQSAGRALRRGRIAPARPPSRPSSSTTRTSRHLSNGLTNAKAVSAAAQKQVRVVFGSENMAAEVTGTDTDYFIARDWKCRSGRAFTESEVRGGTGVCLIGETVRQQFFGAGDPKASRSASTR